MTEKAPPRSENAPSAFAAHLDAMRGIAALAVVVYHIRYKFFLDYTDLPSPGLVTQGFYVITSFGHDAVMVFFALSGYLITGTVLKDLRNGSWSWARYLVNRLSRLYVVFVPGLVLTVIWDSIGMRWFGGHVVYTGALQTWKHDFFDVATTSGPQVFLSNLGFMHAISGTPPLGSNVPLWSLTYELAYYLLFPALAVAVWPGRRPAARVLHVFVAILLAYHFGSRILLYFPIWLLGVGVLLIPVPAAATPSSHATRLRTLLVAAAIVGAAAFRHSVPFTAAAGSASLEWGDFLVGAVCAGAILVLRFDERRAPSPAYARLAHQLAAVSFTLYVVHMPLLIFLRAAVNSGPSWHVTPASLVAVAGLTAATLGYAVAAWFLFERRTPQVRNTVTRLFAAGAKPPLREVIGS